MKALKQKETTKIHPRLAVMLSELGEECRLVLRLLDQLETRGLTEEQAEEILGELSAAVPHLHEHTRGLDAEIEGAASA
jgi:hypothetical protein